MKPLQTTIPQVLTEAIQAEVDSHLFYTRLAEKTSDADAKRTLLDLADRQVVHRAKLERRYKEILGSAPPGPQPPKEPDIAQDDIGAGVARALKIALEHERELESNYRFLAERVPNTELGSLFMELAEIKWKHKIEVESEYNSTLDPEQFLLDI